MAFTASGSGGANCYTVDIHDDGDDSAGGGKVSLVPQWTSKAAPAGGLATLGVCYSDASGAVCAVGEDGVLCLLDPETGACAWSAQTREAALFDAAWCAGLGAHTVVVAGTTLGLWDVRVRAAAPQAVLAPTPGVEAHIAASLLCVSADAQPPYRLAAGASDGALYVWDVRAGGGGGGGGGGGAALAPMRAVAGAHASDVWGVQLDSGSHGQLLSCAADGTLVAWSGLELHAPESAAAPQARTLVQLALPINSLDLSAEHGLLACASDEQVLTFVDLRAEAYVAA